MNLSATIGTASVGEQVAAEIKEFFVKKNTLIILRTKKRCIFAKLNRGVAQLVARYVRDVEAASSSLVTPTVNLMIERV